MDERSRQAWDRIYDLQTAHGSYNRYPTEHVLIFVAKNYFRCHERSSVNALEIGSGAGANLAFLSQEGFAATGIDCSGRAVELAKLVLANAKTHAKVVHACASSMPFPSEQFDFCVESNAIHCNRPTTARAIFDEIHRVLKHGGKFFGILVSDQSAECGQGRQIDLNTFDFSETKTFRRQFDLFPVLHFFSKKEILVLAAKFSSCTLELDVTTFETGDISSPLAYWLVQLVK